MLMNKYCYNSNKENYKPVLKTWTKDGKRLKAMSRITIA